MKHLRKQLADAGVDFDRRLVLKQLGAGLGVLAAGACDPGPNYLGNPAPGVSRDADASRALAGIDNIVVVMMENRSFDHLLGALAMDRDYPGREQVDGLRGDEANFDLQGRPVPLRRRTSDIVATDMSPRWTRSHGSWNGGLNDGFVRASPANLGPEVMTYHDREMAPIHYALADRYTVCDRWFASVMGPTWPNRFYLHAGTARGRKSNQPIVRAGPTRTVWEAMAASGHSARCYFAGVVSWHSMAYAGTELSGRGALVPSRIDEFFKDARNGTLPEFSIIDPDFQIADLHPPRRMVFGEAFLAAVVRALEESPQWRRMMLVITYDEHGGFFDHVAPPRTVDPVPDFAQLGFRVPAIVAGPGVRRGAVVSATLDHVSVLATLRARFGIESFGPRMDAAPDLSCCLDPALLTVAALPRTRGMPTLDLSAAEIRACHGWQDRWDGGHQDMGDALACGDVPANHVDARPVAERLDAWLRVAQELEVLRVTG